jgi:hypothetical protein
MLPFRIRRESKNSSFFNTVVVHNEKSLNLSIRSIQFARTYRKGYGLYSWKPKVLSRALNEIEENDIVIYADAGTKINKQGENRFRDYVEILAHNTNFDGILFSANHTNFPDGYLRASFIPQVDGLRYFSSPYSSGAGAVVYASPIIIRKTTKSVEMVKFWQALCDDFELLSSTVDFDNGLLNFAIGLYGKWHILPGEEVNLYNANGLQSKHVLSKRDYNRLDWSSMIDQPFQNRRKTPIMIQWVNP